ncbi:hypothetical protein Q7P35_003042 [Cladosporium inversicolor]
MSTSSLAGPSGVSSPGISTQQNSLLDTSNSITFVVTPPAEPGNSTANTCSNGMSNGLMVPQLDAAGPLVGSPSTPVPKAQSLITTSPYAQNEGLAFSKGTSLWQPQAGVETVSQRPTQSSPSIISESSFAINEGVKFAPGTSLWQPTRSSTTRHPSGTPSLWTPANASERKSESSALLSMRPMAAPLPASNLITQSPFCSNEGLKFPAGTSMWQPGSVSAFKAQGSTAKTSLVTSSPFDLNETVRFPKATAGVPTRIPGSYMRCQLFTMDWKF